MRDSTGFVVVDHYFNKIQPWEMRFNVVHLSNTLSYAKNIIQEIFLVFRGNTLSVDHISSILKLNRFDIGNKLSRALSSQF